MEKTAIEEVDVELNPMEVHSVRKPVSRALGTEHFAMNYFELEPGESFSGGLHAHDDQEEVFYVEEGTAAFDVGVDRETTEVEGGELIRFSPGEFQMGYNVGDDTLVGWALGAPGASHDWDDLVSRVHCPECGEETTHDTDLVEGRFQVTCEECGNVQS
jgi:quercetin dioxygenase-like cupin family protein